MFYFLGKFFSLSIPNQYTEFRQKKPHFLKKKAKGVGNKQTQKN
jgi:hypothetical protein